MLPAFVMVQAEVDLDEGTPLGPLGLSNEVHACLLRRVIGLAGVARDAGADNVFPNGRAAAVARNNVVQVQVLAVKGLPAILAGIVVPLKNVVPGELDLLLGQAIKHDQQYDPRNTELEGNRVDALGMRLLLGKILPLTKAESLKRTVHSAKHNLRMAFKEESKRAPGGADIDRLPQPVKHQNMLVQKRTHIQYFAVETTMDGGFVSIKRRGHTTCCLASNHCKPPAGGDMLAG